MCQPNFQVGAVDIWNILCCSIVKCNLSLNCCWQVAVHVKMLHSRLTQTAIKPVLLIHAWKSKKADFAEAWNLWGSFKGTTQLTRLKLAAEVCSSETHRSLCISPKIKPANQFSFIIYCFRKYLNNYLIKWTIREWNNCENLTNSIACIFFKISDWDLSWHPTESSAACRHPVNTLSPSFLTIKRKFVLSHKSN